MRTGITKSVTTEERVEMKLCKEPSRHRHCEMVLEVLQLGGKQILLMLPRGAEYPLACICITEPCSLAPSPELQQNGIHQSGQYLSLSTLEKQLRLGFLLLQAIPSTERLQ